MINPELKEKCLKILDELVSHPISAVFQEPVDPTLDEVPDYFDIIKEPSDLSTVRERLLSDKYKNIQEFKREVNLIWENAVAYNGKSSYPAYIADQLSKIFAKQFSMLEDQNYEHWINEFLKARSILFKLFHNPPKSLESTKSIKSDKPPNSVGNSNFLFSDPFIVDVPVEIDDDVFQKDLQFFNDNKNVFNDKLLYSKLAHFLAQNEKPIDISNSNSINLANVSPRKLKRIKELIIEAKSKNGSSNA